MTRRKLDRIRRKYNAMRREHRGWTPQRWDVQCWLCDNDYAFIARWLRRNFGVTP
jgi:hypothetical protein